MNELKSTKALRILSAVETIRKIDFHFARNILFHCETDSEFTSELVSFISALLSSELSKGNICINVSRYKTTRPFGIKEEEFAELFGHLPPRDEWLSILSQSHVVSTSGQTPLILDGDRIYLNRFWNFERNVANCWIEASRSEISHTGLNGILNELFPRPYKFLSAKLAKLTEDGSCAPESRKYACEDILDITDSNSLDWNSIDAVLSKTPDAGGLENLDGLIPDSVRLDWQKVAVASSLLRKFSVISGGPGTGKTTTVVKLLAAILMSAKNTNDRTPVIGLVAPTGKAAARLTESIGGALQTLPLDEAIAENIPTKASTLHRLLGAVKGAAQFRFNKQNRLHIDVLVVDEASMIDLPMMASLLAALPDHAQLILLGDKDQLASVEAGAVLGDICGFSKYGYSDDHAANLNGGTGFSVEGRNQNQLISDNICVLQKSYRFHADSGVGKLANAINIGQPELAQEVLDKGYSDIEFSELDPSSYVNLIKSVSLDYSDYLSAISSQAGPSEVIAKFNDVRLLCAIREGDFGLVGLNLRIESELTTLGLVQPAKHSVWYEGRPIMVTRNDFSTGLFNGDVGITIRCPEENCLKVFFELPTGEIKGYQTCRIPDHETVFAMTIHKSQGSEFKNTYMVLPTTASPIITRELVYTGVTRSKGKLKLFSTMEILKRGIRLRTIRHSGLSHQLKRHKD